MMNQTKYGKKDKWKGVLVLMFLKGLKSISGIKKRKDKNL